MRATLRAGRPSLDGVPDLPAAARLVVWGNAALCGAVSPDEAADRVTGPTDASHRMFGLPGEDGGVSLPYALARLPGWA